MQSKLPSLFVAAAVAGGVAIWGVPAAHSALAGSDSPVLVELFTSEGCSSCPPADTLLEKLDSVNNPTGPQVIVLSEHVDYWNSTGWKDPYSSPAFSQRQQAYAKQFHLSEVYTPEMVVDGAAEFVGSDGREARDRIAAAAGRKSAIPVYLNRVSPEVVRVEIPAATNAVGKGFADVVIAMASNEASTQVLGGENGGRKLHHVAVARSITPIGQIHDGESFSREIHLGDKARGLRVIAWVQQPGQGRVLGSAIRVW